MAGETSPDATRRGADSDAESRVTRALARSMLVTRWIMAPIYIGLLGALLLIAIKSVQKLVMAAPRILDMDANETVLTVLRLVDMSLVANLLVIVMYFGWENFVGPLTAGTSGRGMTGLDFAAVKLKLFSSITAIAAVHMLETFVHVGEVTEAEAKWGLLILLGIGGTGVLLALMDRLGADNHS